MTRIRKRIVILQLVVILAFTAALGIAKDPAMILTGIAMQCVGVALMCARG